MPEEVDVIWEPYLFALAGLLSNPSLSHSLSEVIPARWMEPVKKHLDSEMTLFASRLAAGNLAADKPAAVSTKRLRSIFCDLNADGFNGTPEALFWPVKHLSLQEGNPFPLPANAPTDKTPADLLADFFKKGAALQLAFNDAKDEQLPAFLENLLFLLQHDTWCLPCNVDGLDDVSLYDQSRMTAALAALWQGQPPADGAHALLVGGDISGLQDFIYMISSDGAASALRGRSFYLQLLNEIWPRQLLADLNLPACNIIYAGGGNFYLLARPSDGEKIAAFQRSVSRVLLRHHHGDLYLALADVPLEKSHFTGGLSARWQALGDKLQHAKHRRFAEMDNLADLFAPQGSGGNEEKQCRVCGLEHATTKKRKHKADDPDIEGVRKCEPCFQYEELGDDLRRAEVLTLLPCKVIQESAIGTWQSVLAQFGMQASVNRDTPKEENKTTSAVVLALSDSAWEKLPYHGGQVTGRKFLVNVTPSAENGKSVKPFDQLESQSDGINRLGVLRMDVDNLGKLFSDGLKTSNLSRIASLSGAVSLFFDGWVEQLAGKLDQAGRLYSIYSGGDDLFFVGSWNVVAELARVIRADLQQYTGNHPGIHASAGIALVGGKYPLYQAASHAGQAEEESKAFRWLKDGREREKDAITFLGQTVSWDRFGTQPDAHDMSTIYGMMRTLKAMFDDAPNAPKSLLGTLMDLQEKQERAAKERRKEKNRGRNLAGQEQVLWGPWHWQGYYTLKRMVQRTRNDLPTFSAKVDDIAEKKLKAERFVSVDWIGFAARWTELILREKQ